MKKKTRATKVSFFKRYEMYFLPLGLAFCFMAFSPGRITVVDVGSRLHLAHSLWTEGTVFFRDTASAVVQVTTPEGETTKYGVGQSLLFIPFDMMGALFAKVAAHVMPANTAAQTYVATAPLTFFYPPLLGLAWWAALVGLLQQFGLNERRSRWGATMFALGTVAFVYITQNLQEESAVGCFITAALTYALKWRKSLRPNHAFLTGAFFGAALLFRLNAAFALLPIAGAAFSGGMYKKKNIKKLMSGAAFVVVGMLPFIAAHFAFAYWRFNNAFETGYGLTHLNLQSMDLGKAMALLVGPGKGIFVFSPILLLSLYGLRKEWKKRPLLWASTGAAIVASALFHSRLVGFSDGSHSWSARYQVHLLSFLVFPMTVACLELWKTRSGKALTAALFLFGFGVQMMGCLAPDTLEYAQLNERGLMDQETMLMSFHDGQLYLRAKNTLHWLRARGNSAAMVTAGDSRLSERMIASYMPNVWGPAYAKKWQGPAAGYYLAYAAWSLCAMFALFLLAYEFRSLAPKSLRSKLHLNFGHLIGFNRNVRLGARRRSHR